MNPKKSTQDQSTSFIVRSSSIRSKSNTTHIYSDPQSPQNVDYFPSITLNKKFQSRSQLQKQIKSKDKQLKDRQEKLNLNLKTLQKQYKFNLKEAFENKIQSYRLQAVMQRKIIKQTILETLNINEIQQINEKHQTALKRKQINEYNLQKQQEFREKQLQNLRKKIEIEKKRNNYSITARQRQIETKNKSLHDRILNEQKHKDRKKNYLEYYRQQKIQREEFEMKKEFLQKIVSNSKKIKNLKDQLQNVQQRCVKLFVPSSNSKKIDTSHLFVTI